MTGSTGSPPAGTCEAATTASSSGPPARPGPGRTRCRPAPGRWACNLVMIPPGSRGMPHYHDDRETALYLVSGETEVWHGADLAKRSTVRAGDFIYIPPGTPHLAVNRGDVTSIAVAAESDPADDGRHRRGRTATAPGRPARACRSRSRNEPTTPPRAPPAGRAANPARSGGSSSAAAHPGASLPPPPDSPRSGRGPRWCSSGAAARSAGERSPGASSRRTRTPPAAGRRRPGCGRRRPGRCGGPAASTWPRGAAPRAARPGSRPRSRR